MNSLKGRSSGASPSKSLDRVYAPFVAISVSIGETRAEAQTGSTISRPLTKSRRRGSIVTRDNPTPGLTDESAQLRLRSSAGGVETTARALARDPANEGQSVHAHQLQAPHCRNDIAGAS